MKFDKLVERLLKEAEEKTLDVNDIRKQLNVWMDKDQKLKPEERKDLQKEAWAYIIDNLELIKKDTDQHGEDLNWPSAYCAWLLVQHMDANPERQEQFLPILKELASIQPMVQPKIKFLQDRLNVNKMIKQLYTANPTKYDELNPNYKEADSEIITQGIRDGRLFPTDSQKPTTAKAAYDQIVRANNNPLFINALDAARGSEDWSTFTQPSFNG
jgi:hypothetical protein